MNDKTITIYTDGAARGNPGPGGYGIVLICNPYRKEISEGYRKTTNNRMELLAVIVALESLKQIPSNVILYSDSKYVTDAINKNWIDDWTKRNFNKIKNPDLWKRFIEIWRKHKVNFVWIKGHSDNKENNLCDQLAVKASFSNNPKIDEYYELNSENI